MGIVDGTFVISKAVYDHACHNQERDGPLGDQWQRYQYAPKLIYLITDRTHSITPAIDAARRPGVPYSYD